MKLFTIPQAILVIIFSSWRGGFRKTDSIVNRLIRGAIQTGLFAGIFSLGDLITFVIVPKTELYAMFVFPIGRIYTNVSVINVTNVCCTMTWTFFAFVFGRPFWILSSLVTRSGLRCTMGTPSRR